MKYEGSLKKGIVRKKLGPLAPDAELKKESERLVNEMFAKLPELFAAHAVSEGNWPALALALAKEHVPGFKFVNPPGRKTEWQDYDKAELKIEVDEVANTTGLSIVESIKLVIRREKWAVRTKETSLAALQQVYYNVDPRWVKLLNDAKAYESIVSGN